MYVLYNTHQDERILVTVSDTLLRIICSNYGNGLRHRRGNRRGRGLRGDFSHLLAWVFNVKLGLLHFSTVVKR